MQYFTWLESCLACQSHKNPISLQLGAALQYCSSYRETIKDSTIIFSYRGWPLVWNNGILEFLGVWINSTLPIMTSFLFFFFVLKTMGNLSWCCFLELLFDFWGQMYFHHFLLLLAFRSPSRSLYSFILNRQEICPILLTFVCLISFSSSQVPYFNGFLLLCIPPMSLQLLPFIWKPTFLCVFALLRLVLLAATR